MSTDTLLDIAREAAKKAYSPYSVFGVGAALKCKNGKIYTGCNIENSSFSATVCAERTAFYKALSEGEREFEMIAVVGGREGNFEKECTPCGICRQVMAEFCGKDFVIITTKNKYTLEQLLPKAFTFNLSD
ncbi:MAG: Cytidine deaminase [Candidatus Aerophobetes bacterium ADurb.Bin490]|jgi:cytidine deaminase|nr:cytidine deaminase [Clostridiales bacterium]OPZ65549.1 MAG: Cytidine deaminase [Candidatus Aerophobetes bacterium ADurb.Bin490]